MLPAGWHRSFQILAACIWARTWDVRSYTWVWSVAMAGVENWEHDMLHRTSNNLVFFVLGAEGGRLQNHFEDFWICSWDIQEWVGGRRGGWSAGAQQLRIVGPSWRANPFYFLVLCISSWEFVGFKFASEATHTVESTFSEQAEIIYSFKVGPRGSGDP